MSTHPERFTVLFDKPPCSAPLVPVQSAVVKVLALSVGHAEDKHSKPRCRMLARLTCMVQ